MFSKFSLSIFALLTTLVLQAQCPYDHDNDGDVGNGYDPFPYWLNMGTDSASTDHNGNGITDIEDMLEYRRHFGYNCPVPEIPEADLVSGLVLAVHNVNTTEYSDTDNTLPLGAVTYRLYAQLNAEATVNGIYGIADHPFTLSTNTAFWQSGFASDDGYATNITVPLLTETFPSASFSSWFAFDVPPFSGVEVPFADAVLPQPEVVSDAFEGGAGFSIDAPEGGGYVLTYETQFPESTVPGLALIAQITVMDGGTLSGQLNLSVLEGPDVVDATGYQTLYDLTFSSDNLTDLGCMDPLAENYDPAAVFDDGTCAYFGDVNDDGAVDTMDILDMLGDFGCSTCEDSDLDDDGFSGVSDLLLLLGLI